MDKELGITVEMEEITVRGATSKPEPLVFNSVHDAMMAEKQGSN